MQTLKTAIIVVLLLVVFYGVYEMLNSPPAEEPPSVASLPPDATAELDIDLGDDMAGFGDAPSEPMSPDFSATSGSGDAPPAGLGGESRSADDARSYGSVPSFLSPNAPDTRSSSATNPNETPPASQAVSHFSTPSSPGAARPAASSPSPSSNSSMPRADSSVVAIPADPKLQHNPYIDGEVVPKPMVSGSQRETPEQQNIGARAYQRARQMAESLIAEGDYHAALSALSVFYKSPDLNDQEHRELLDLLDPLAARVVYSREHLLEDPYTVRRNETLMDIAKQYDVPYRLLRKINGIEDPKVLLPGSELKIVPGPFRAEIDLDAQELTLFLDRLYAGRFPITLGADPEPFEGDFEVRDKQHDKTYFSLDGRTIAGDSPANPFGRVWVDLGREVCIHGSPEKAGGQRRGCISLSPRDADDVYSILSVGSKVRILR